SDLERGGGPAAADRERRRGGVLAARSCEPGPVPDQVMERHDRRAAAPQYSPDGRWRWSGREWLAANLSATSGEPARKPAELADLVLAGFWRRVGAGLVDTVLLAVELVVLS